MKYIPFLLAVIFLQGCTGDIALKLSEINEGEASGVSLNLSPEEKLFVAAASFTDPVGSIATVGLNNPHETKAALQITDSSDVVIRSFDGRLFVVNRGTATVQVIDPQTFETIGNYSVGAMSNPQDLLVDRGKAYVTRMDANKASGNKDDLWIVNPENGKLIRSVDLEPFVNADGDRQPRASEMALVGDFLYILLKDLSSNYKATAQGKVAILDTLTDKLVDADATISGTQVIELKGRNPAGIVYNETLDRIFIADSGFFDDFDNDLTTPFGGIEVLNPKTNKTEGILIDDLDFGGFLSSLTIVSEDLAAVITDAKTVATFDPANLTPINTSLYTSPSGFIPEILADQNGFLWVPERNPTNGGMVLVDPSSGAPLGGPFPVGALPLSMTLIR